MASNGAAAVTVRAAIEVLKSAGPLHYKDLAARLFAAPHNIAKRGKDPEYTVYADLFFAVKANHPELRMVGRGVYALTEHGDVQGANYAPGRASTPAPAPKPKTPAELTDEEIVARMRTIKGEYDLLGAERKRRIDEAQAKIDAKKTKRTPKAAPEPTSEPPAPVAPEAEVATEAEPEPATASA